MILTSLYLIYLVLVAFFLLFYGKIPKIYQLIMLITLMTLLASHSILTSISVAISNFRSGNSTLSDLLLTFSYAYVNAWKTYDNSLIYSVKNIDKNIENASGLIIFFGIDMLYLITLTMIILWFFETIFGSIIYKYSPNINEEKKKEISLFLTLLSLLIAYTIAKKLFNIYGYDIVIKYLFEKVKSLFM